MLGQKILAASLGDRGAVPLVAALFLLPAVHPLLIPYLGVPSHLLWFVHVMPVAVLAYRYGVKSGLASVAGSALLVAVGELTFGSGFGHAADATTVIALTTAVGATDLLVAAFALAVRAEETARSDLASTMAAALSTSAEAVIVADADGMITSANDAAIGLLGRPAAGSGLADMLVAPGDAHRVLAAGGGQPVTVAARDPSGHPFAAEITVSPVRRNGRPSAYLLSLRDQSEALRAQANERRTRALSDLGEVMASVAHELNNPLTAVRTLAEVAAGDSRLPSDLRDDLMVVDSEARRAAGIARLLLGMVRTGEKPREPTDMNRLLREAVRANEPMFAAHGIKVQLRLDDTIPPVNASGDEIRQVVGNLFGNAKDAMFDANGRGTLKVSSRAHEGHVEVTISDDGPGIPPSSLARLFAPFFTTKKVGSGTGLGLAIARRILREHQGDLSVRSEEGLGAAFTLHLPAAQGRQSQSRAVDPVRDGTFEPRTLRVLVIDDEPAIRRAARRLLASRGHHVEEAADAAGAMGLLNEQDFDVVLCDVHIGQDNGLDLYREVRSARPDSASRFVFVTGDVLTPDLRKLIEAEGARSVPKPFETRQLLTAVRAAAGTHP